MSEPQASNAPAVHAAILAVARELCEMGIGKDNKNKEQNFMFRGIDDVINALAPLLVKHGLHITPRTVEHKSSTHTNAKGTLWTTSVVRIEYTIYCAADGSKVVGEGVGEGRDAADKSTSKAASIAYKYWAIQAFSIPTVGILIDGDSEGPEIDGQGDRQPPARRGRDAQPERRQVIYEIAAKLKAAGLSESKFLADANSQANSNWKSIDDIDDEWATYLLEGLTTLAN